MSELSILREGWDEIEEMETRLLRSLSIQESVKQWLQLQQAFEWQLQQTAELFEPQRREAMIELQSRLHRLVEQ
jgi:hypothetical protein